MNSINQPLGLINPGNLQSNEKFIIDIFYEMFPDEKTKIFFKGNYFIIWNEFTDPFDKKEYIYQCEYPANSTPWFIDTIENKFWNHKPSPSSLPGDVSESTVIDGEKIGINPMRHCCAENLFGYSFWNASRQSYISKRAHHDWQIPRYMLEQGLLDQLKKISTDLGLKKYF